MCCSNLPTGIFFQQTAELAADFHNWNIFNTSSRPKPDSFINISIHTNDIDEYLSDMAADHLRLFSGPNPLAPLWESVWLEKDNLLFGERTDEVADFYIQWGLVSTKANSEPPDHLGLELSFLAYLLRCHGGYEIYDNNDNAGKAAIKFLDQHVLKFALPVLEKSVIYADTKFYKWIVKNTLTMLENLRQILKRDFPYFIKDL